MSDFAAIARITERMRQLLEAALGGRTVMTLPLHKLGSGEDELPKLNLLLYQILPSAARANTELPWRKRPGESGRPPLALDLRYLLTAVRSDQEIAQADLGLGMQVFHENPVLMPGGRAVEPYERIRVSLHPLGLDEMEKIWANATTPRRLSVAYEVSVALIEREEPDPAPLPVLARNIGMELDGEILVAPFVGSGFTIDGIEIGTHPFDQWLRKRKLRGRVAAEIDDLLLLRGRGLGTAQAALITSYRFPEARLTIAGPFETVEGGMLAVRLRASDVNASLPAGPCEFVLESGPGREALRSNAMPLRLAPRIVTMLSAGESPDGTRWVFDVEPPLRDSQRTTLLVAGRQLTPEEPPGLSFILPRLAPGRYPVRIRVDGTDSTPFDLDRVPAGEAVQFSDASSMIVG